MPLVTLTGNVSEHGLAILPESLQQRLWLVPNKGHIKGSRALDGQPVLCALNRATGAFTADVWSTLEPDLFYTLRADWLIPGQESEPSEERARAFFEWPVPIFPDTGGPIGDLVEIIAGLGLVYVSDAVAENMSPVPRYQLAYNPSTTWLYQREITW
ncbi:hypothetical protein [Microbacterium gilvum]|uniref:Uncharacterized protein n=1 Tax=Microbacterium gilvum TaxID=1336204 RepID=A0ABP9A6F1_9MICO